MIYINDIFDIFDIFDFKGFMSVRTCSMLKQSIPGKYQKYRDIFIENIMIFLIFSILRFMSVNKHFPR